MPNTALLVGNSDYRFLDRLTCCHDDLLALKEMLEATEKYAEIEVIENVDADELKSKIRTATDKSQPTEELFFYFTGHGCQQEDEFYYCATNFDSKRPNETGISTSELHTLLRLANAELVVKLIDACNSGTLLLKADGAFAAQQKHSFKNLIQISSCLDSQNSLTGDPLSVFTEKFRASALRKPEGIVYYTDIIYALRDEYLQNNSQTPFFVAQGTGREHFVDEAKRFDALRTKLAGTPSSPPLASEDQEISPAPPTLLDLLRKAEQKIATPDQVSSLVDSFFDNLIKAISTDEFANFFELNITEHSYFMEPTPRNFMTRILSQESRPDNFVTATIEREKKRATGWPGMMAAANFAGMFADDQDYKETYHLQLNCRMSRAQISIALTPKYQSLKRLVLVISCAPSLETCYVFEVITQHRLKDFGEFEDDGQEVVSRWYKLNWTQNTPSLVTQIASRLNQLVREHLKSAGQRLTKDTS